MTKRLINYFHLKDTVRLTILIFTEPTAERNPRNSWPLPQTKTVPKSTSTTVRPLHMLRALLQVTTQPTRITTTTKKTAGRCQTSTTRPIWRRVFTTAWTAKWTAWPDRMPAFTALKTIYMIGWNDTPILVKKVMMMMTYEG